MFFHLFKYRIIKLIKSREELFWTFMFPLILGTFFYVAFSSITDKTENFTSIPVAVVIENDNADTFKETISNLDKNVTGDDSSLLDVSYVSLKEARDLLTKEKIDGIILFEDGLSLEISKNGINQTILKSFIDNYLHIESVITTVGQENPAAIMTVVANLMEDTDYNTELSLTDRSFDPMILYFYALIAMSCLFGSQIGCSCAKELKADLSALGSRRCIAPTPRMLVILADFLATILVHFISILILILYLVYVLKIDMGDRMGLVILTGFVGSVIGVSFGFFVGSLKKIPENAKFAIVLAVSMLLSFLGGLMVADMKYLVEEVFPLLNRVNPAVLISDALYSLCFYDTYEKFIFSLTIMLIIAAIFCILSYFVTRRETYDNL